MESNHTPTKRSEDSDNRNSLKHILAADGSKDNPSPESTSPAKADQSIMNAEESTSGGGDAPNTASKADTDVPMYTATTTTTRRNANGSVSSVYSGNKIRHLKKDDGIPLWRKDIQYDFLRLVFEDDKAVFHKISDGTNGHTFCDIYLDAMAKSSKCSKILKDKLLTERSQAINMAMVCLLVNVGRMNTTLNCKSALTVSEHDLCREIELIGDSFPGDASATSNLSFYPVITSQPGSERV